MNEAILLIPLGVNSTMDVAIRNTRIVNAKPSNFPFHEPASMGGAITWTTFFAGANTVSFSLLMENTDVIGSTENAITLWDTMGSSPVIDLGGGALGSVGNNRIFDNVAGDVEL